MRHDVRERTAWLVLAVAIIVGLALRLHDLTADGLWLDELWGATFAQLGLRDLMVAVIRLDVHPPLYYLQLKLWAALFGASDAALLANSVFWSTLTIAAAFVAARRVLGLETAVMAACLTAVAGGEVYYAHELRMYAMMAFLTVMAWSCCDEYVEKRTIGGGIALAVITGLLATSHGASVVPVSCVLLYLLLRLGIREAFRRGAVLIYLTVGLATLPWIVNSWFHELSHIDAASFALVGETIGGWLFGYRFDPRGVREIAACVIVAAAAIVALMSRRAGNTVSRDMVLAFLLWPMLFVFAASVLLRPIWIPRLFEFCVPFAAIAIASALARPGPRIVLAGVLILAMGASSFAQGEAGRKMEYREAAGYLASHVHPGDVIYAPHIRWFWGIARYFVGPDWGNALTIQDPVRPGKSTAWDGIYARLGHDWLARLNLIPLTREIHARDVTLVIGWSPSDTVRAASHVWLVGSNTIEPGDVELCEIGSVTPHVFRGVTVQDIECAGAR
jgi:mannosyltransferase